MTVNKTFFKKKDPLPHPTHRFVENEVEKAIPELPAIPEDEELEVAPARPRFVHRRRETRSKRLNLLITPSLYDAILRKAQDLDISFNEACNLAFEQFLKRRSK